MFYSHGWITAGNTFAHLEKSSFTDVLVRLVISGVFSWFGCFYNVFQITPRFGPLKGGIAVTIKGMNLGIQKDDIKNITVAGVPCKHLQERYSVSTR